MNSAARALTVLEFLSKRSNPTPTTVIGRECGIPKSSVHNLLNLMRDRRFVSYRKDDRAWTLGPRLFELGADAPLLVHALAVFRAFERGGRHLEVREIVRLSELTAGTVKRVLPLLVDGCLLTRGPDDRYGLGLELVSLASRVGDIDRLRISARPALLSLRDVTGETANLVVRDGEHALYIDQVESRQALRHTGWTGRQIPLGVSAAGRVLTGAAGAIVVRDAVEEGVTAVACAIEGVDDPAAAVTLTGPSFRLHDDRLDMACAAVEDAAEAARAALLDRTRPRI